VLTSHKKDEGDMSANIHYFKLLGTVLESENTWGLEKEIPHI
jgi:hypothetical protein